MSARRGLFVLAITAITASAAAQHPVGATYRTSGSVGSRGALLSEAGTQLTRFERDDLRGFGMTTPGTHVIQGFRSTLVDRDGSTAETWSLVLCVEDPANPGYPLLASPRITVGPFVTPPANPGLSTVTVTTSLATPVAVAAGGDLFVGVHLAAAPTWPGDGLAVECVLGHSSRWPVYDEPGPAPIQHGSYALAYTDAFGLIGYNTVRQLRLDLLTPTPGGAATVVTNEMWYTINNVVPGGGGFLSALHPDARQLPLHSRRADDVGFAFLDPATADGSPVFFFAEFTGFAPETSLQGIVPGSRGVVCIALGNAEVMTSRTCVGGTAAFTLPIPRQVRAVLAGVSMIQQAAALDAATGAIHASPCTRTAF